jgi:hypothetical protein
LCRAPWTSAFAARGDGRLVSQSAEELQQRSVHDLRLLLLYAVAGAGTTVCERRSVSHGVSVLEVADRQIVGIEAFLDPTLVPRFGVIAAR